MKFGKSDMKDGACADPLREWAGAAREVARRFRFVLLLRAMSCAALLVCSGGVALGGQQSGTEAKALPDAPTPKQASAPKQGESAQAGEQPRGEGRLRGTLEILGRRSVFFPELAFNKGPLLSREKLELSVDETIAPSRFFGSAFTSGISQARNTLSGYGQEWGGYSKRYGSSVASNATSHFLGTYLFPSLLHQDPRYFVKLHASPTRRVLYALSRVAITRTDAGGEAFNWSGILGSMVAEGFADTYLPSEQQTYAKTFTRIGVRIGFGAFGNVVKEYWPTIFKSLRMSKFVPDQGTDPGTVRPPIPTGPPSPPPKP